MSRRTAYLTVMTVAVALVTSGCSFLGTLGTEEAVSCSIGGGSQFSKTYMSSPDLTPDGFRATPQGRTLEAFFVGGEGEVEAGPYANLGCPSMSSGTSRPCQCTIVSSGISLSKTIRTRWPCLRRNVGPR